MGRGSGNGGKHRSLCCCMPGCTLRVLIRILLLDIVLIVGVAYLIKFLWMRAEWVQHKPAPPPTSPPPPPPTNDTMTLVPMSPSTPPPAVVFPWADVIRTSNFAAWNSMYLRALAISTALVLIATVFLWYLGASIISGLRSCAKWLYRNTSRCLQSCKACCCRCRCCCQRHNHNNDNGNTTAAVGRILNNKKAPSSSSSASGAYTKLPQPTSSSSSQSSTTSLYGSRKTAVDDMFSPDEIEAATQLALARLERQQ